MIRSFIINKYLSKEFSKVVLNTTLIFFSLGIVMNLFEEINFFKDIDIGIYLPLTLSILVVPSLLYNMFPFIIFISGIWFFLKIKKSDEATALNVSGLSNISIIIIPCVISILMGVFFITSLNPVTSVLVKKYEVIKGSYERDKDYLAALTKNGIWIREKNDFKNNIIRSSSLDGNKLINLTIYEFDQKNDFIKRIEAKSGDISTMEWFLSDVNIIDAEGIYLSKGVKQIKYISAYDVQSIKSLYSNLDTVSFWNIKDEMRLLEERGYSTLEMRAKLQRSFAFPFFLISMVLLAAVFTLGVRIKENNLNYTFIAIIGCVLIYFFNDFSSVLGKTDKLPMKIAIWMPITIIFIFSSIGIIHANQK